MLSLRLTASDHAVLMWLTVLSVTCDLRAHHPTFRKLATKASTSKTRDETICTQHIFYLAVISGKIAS